MTVSTSSGAAEASTTTARAFQIRLLAMLVTIGVGLLLVELSLRLFGALGGLPGERLAGRDPLATVYESFGNAGYRPKPGKVEIFQNGTRAHYNSMAFRGPLVSVSKPAGVYRVLLAGGSTTVGYDVDDDQTIDEYMRRQLAQKFPGRCFEVVNLGLGGYDSYQDYERVRVDGIPLSPDLLIIHSGINDVRNAQYDNLSSPPDPRTLIWEVEMQRMRNSTGVRHLWIIAKHYSFVARFPGYLFELMNQRETLHTIQVVEPHDDALAYFETNLTRTVDLVLQAGGEVILSKPPSALTIRNRPTDPVEKSYWIKDAATTEAYRNRLGERMNEIAQRYQAEGKPVSYLTHNLPLDQYIDDAHLAPSGNESLARDFVAALSPSIARTQVPPQCPAH